MRISLGGAEKWIFYVKFYGLKLAFQLVIVRNRQSKGEKRIPNSLNICCWSSLFKRKCIEKDDVIKLIIELAEM